MKIGVQLPEVERRVPWSELRAMALLVEDGGLDSIWLGEHLLYETPNGRKGPWEAFTMMAAIAAVTERVQIGPLVAATSFHNPALLAKQAATLDEVSGGRFILGLGAGWNRTEFDAFGYPFDNRASRFEEAFTIIRTLLREGSIDFHGTYYDLGGCELDPLGPTPGGPPLLVGSTGSRLLAATLAHVQLWNAWYSAYDNDPQRVPALLRRIDEAAAAAGRELGDLAKTLAMLWHFETEPVTRDAENRINGDEAKLEALATLASAGVDTVQLVLDPITLDTIEQVVSIVRSWSATT